MKQIARMWAGAVAVIALSAATAQAQDHYGSAPIAASRPGAAEVVSTVGAGVVQVEAGYAGDRAHEETEHAVGQVRVRFGIGERAEVRVGLSSYAWDSAHGRDEGGWQGASVGAKVKALKGHGWVPGVALFATGYLPGGSKGYSVSEFTPEAGASVEWHLGHEWAVIGTAGYAWAEYEAETVGALAVAYHASKSLHLHAEVERHGNAPWSDHGHYAHAVAGGASWIVTPNLVLDAWTGVERDDHGDDKLRFGLGFAHRWGAKKSASSHPTSHGADPSKKH